MEKGNNFSCFGNNLFGQTDVELNNLNNNHNVVDTEERNDYINDEF